MRRYIQAHKIVRDLFYDKSDLINSDELAIFLDALRSWKQTCRGWSSCEPETFIGLGCPYEEICRYIVEKDKDKLSMRNINKLINAD